MTLASRAAAVPAAARPVPSTTPTRQAAVPSDRTQGSRPQGARLPGGRGAGQFQSLRVLTDQNGASNEEQQPDAADASRLLLPPGFSPDASTESVTSIGSAQASAPIGFGDRPDFSAATARAGRATRPVPADPGGGPGGRGFGGGPGFGGGQGFGGGPGGGRRPGRIRARCARESDPRVGVSESRQLQPRCGALLAERSADREPFLLPDAARRDRRGTARDSRTHFEPEDVLLRELHREPREQSDRHLLNRPTAAERAGDLAALGRTIIDPSTGQPFAGNQIPASRMDSASLSLLNLFPLPNQPGTKQNFHYQTTTGVNTDDINVRLVHNFGQPTPGQGRGRGGGGGRGFGPGGGGGTSSLNVTIHYRHQDNEAASAFPSIGGSTRLSAWDVPVGYTFTTHGISNTLRLQYNRQEGNTLNLFAGVQDVAATAGVLGVSTDPFDWGAPSLSFSSFASLNDLTPSLRRNQTISVGDQMLTTRGRHTLRWGGDYRDIRSDGRADPNARGSFVFTGLYSGADFADFLLGLPQQASVQFGAGLSSSARSRGTSTCRMPGGRATRSPSTRACATSTSRLSRPSATGWSTSTCRPTSPPPCRCSPARPDRTSGISEFDRHARSQQRGAARRDRLAAGRRAGRAGRLRDQLQHRRLSDNRPAARQPAAVRARRHHARHSGGADRAHHRAARHAERHHHQLVRR